jgi:hypothetical protein
MSGPQHQRVVIGRLKAARQTNYAGSDTAYLMIYHQKQSPDAGAWPRLRLPVCTAEGLALMALRNLAHIYAVLDRAEDD